MGWGLVLRHGQRIKKQKDFPMLVVDSIGICFTMRITKFVSFTKFPVSVQSTKEETAKCTISGMMAGSYHVKQVVFSVSSHRIFLLGALFSWQAAEVVSGFPAIIATCQQWEKHESSVAFFMPTLQPLASWRKLLRSLRILNRCTQTPLECL